MTVLVTGGAGYIGTHACVELLNKGYNILVVDNFSNSKAKALDKVKEITGKEFTTYNADLTNYEEVDNIFYNNNIESVIHFAGFKSVNESINNPLEYYFNNVLSTINLTKVMGNYDVKKFIFSSSATVYGDVQTLPINEDFNLTTKNPYGRTKLVNEEILWDLYYSDNNWNIAVLRYFNPVGAHKSGLIGEDSLDTPDNLMPYITQVASGRLAKLNVYGDDYQTRDGTGVRDYIHVVDLAEGHVKALEYCYENNGFEIFNLGTGKGYSVLEIKDTFEKVNQLQIPYKIIERRLGDVAESFADPSKAKSELGWSAKYDIEDMCVDSWVWQKNNPNGF